MPISKVDVRLPGIEGRGRLMSAQTRHHFTTLRQINQLIEASAAEPDLGFMARLLALCSLPRTNQRDRLQYERSNGPYKLCMIAGSGKKLPFGNVPRLLLAWVCSEAVRTQSRELVLGRSLYEFMRKLGMADRSGSARGDRARLKNQIRRSHPNSLESLHQPGAATAPPSAQLSSGPLGGPLGPQRVRASRYPHALSVRTAVFVNARIMSIRFRPAVLRSSCSSQDRRAVWRASGRSRWRSAATASRRRSRAAPMGSATVKGSGCRGMSQSSLGAMVACDGRSLAGPTHLSAVCERRSTDRSRSTACMFTRMLQQARRTPE